MPKRIPEERTGRIRLACPPPPYGSPEWRGEMRKIAVFVDETVALLPPRQGPPRPWYLPRIPRR